MKPTIKPRNAITLWPVGDMLMAELPGQGKYAHTIAVQNSVDGIQKLLRILNSRHEQSLIGETGDPTQHHVDRLSYDPAKIKRKKPTFSQHQMDGAKEVLRKLGLI